MEVKKLSGLISDIIENSIADELNIVAGDILLKINDREINDILDYRFYTQEEYLLLELKKKNGEVWQIEIEKDDYEDLGILFKDLVFDKMKSCSNRCVFCFVDQLPEGMRQSLYVKDDDYRYSFLLGNYVTLTNLSEEDWQKILQMRLSPLYISVHCTDGDTRKLMMNNKNAGKILQDLKRLKEARIELHTQIVLCPGINDGLILEKSIEDLSDLYPSVQTVGIVPVGLTAYRQELETLKSISVEEAKALIKWADKLQNSFREKWGSGFIYLADEFYIKAGLDVPEQEYYDGFEQIENGIGLARILLDDFIELEEELPISLEESKEIYIICGASAFPILRKIVARMNKINNLHLSILQIDNNFFAGEVNVTGLLTGKDILTKLGENYLGKKVIIPEIVFQEGNELFLDDVDLDLLKKSTGAEISVADGSARQLVDLVLR